MPKINVLVVEDESIASKDIQDSLKKMGFVVCGAAATGEKAILLVDELKPDIILMDIMLKDELNGIEAAEIIKKEHQIPIIFLTAYADETTLEKAKITEPHGYINKPFEEIDLNTTIEMALYKHQKETEVTKERNLLHAIVENKKTRNFIFVKSKAKLVKLRTKDIYYVEALKDYVAINTLKNRYTIHSTMKEVDRKLGDKDFVRVHRSYIVRLDKIASIEYPNLQLDDEKKLIPIGGSYKDQLVKNINLI